MKDPSTRPLHEKETTDFFACVLWAILTCSVLGRLAVIFSFHIHGDEFFFLDHVYAHERGSFIPVFHTLYVHAFKWLPMVSGNEADQIIAARLVMFVFQVGTAFFLYKICRLFFTHVAALFAVLAYFCFSYVVLQGASFRDDPIAAFCLVVAFYYLLARPRSFFYCVLAGVFTALAAMMTMKSVFYMPTFGIVLLAFWGKAHWNRQLFLRILLFAGMTASCIILFYSVHSTTLVTHPDDGSQAMIVGSYRKTINFLSLSVNFHSFLLSFKDNTLFWIVALIGFVFSVIEMCRRDQWLRGVICAATALPLLSLLFYRHISPYYYVFLLPMVAPLCAMAWDGLMRKKTAETYVFLFIVLLSFVLSVVKNGFFIPWKEPLTGQRQTLASVHAFFPDPVPYLDAYGMVSSFPWAGFFISPWGIEHYLFETSRTAGAVLDADDKAAVPEPWGPSRPFAEIIRDEQPKFIVANVGVLDVFAQDYNQEFLVDADVKALQDNFIPVSEDILIAGRSFMFDEKAPWQQEFTVLIGGRYTLLSAVDVMIDSTLYRQGEVIALPVGQHRIALAEAARAYPLRIDLLWGDRH